jgi:acyl-CoA thioester hydrolase
MPEPFIHELRVRYGEVDPQGIVFNANYLLYVDVAFTELWRELVGPWMAMTERGVDVVLAELNVRFRAPARYDDVIELRPRIVALGASSIQTETDILRDGQLLVATRGRHVTVDTETWAKTDIPDWLRERLEAGIAAAPEESGQAATR